MKIKGVDLSYCQEGISFPVLKQAGVRFAIIRAGFSTRSPSMMAVSVPCPCPVAAREP